MNRFRSSTSACLAVVLLFGFLANLPFWTASFTLGIWCHGFFCIEYLLIGIAAFFLPRWATASLLLVVTLADLVCGISETYYLSPSECITSSVFLAQFSIARLLAIFIVVLLMAVIAYLPVRYPLNHIRGVLRRRAILSLAVFALACVAADYTTLLFGLGRVINPLRASTLADGAHPIYFRGLRLARPVTLRLVRNEQFYALIRRTSHIAPDSTPAPSASTVAIARNGLFGNLPAPNITRPDGSISAPRPNIVLVLVESWGLAIDPTLRDLLTRPYMSPQISSRYQVTFGSVPFFGSTVAGESRELCFNHMNLHLLNATPEEFARCLPHHVASLGYTTIAVHGMDGHMFNRLAWYPRLGFSQLYFRDYFRKLDYPECYGAFTATCDADIAHWIGTRLAQTANAPDFIYWVTINSHLPVNTPAPVSHPAVCPPAIAAQPNLCSWAQLVTNVHQSIAQVASGSLPRNTIFVLVGDHAPPFVTPSLRSQFSATNVPYIILTPTSEIETSQQ